MAKIVLVEDEENIRKELMVYLENAGYETAAVEDFSHAVQEVLSLSPDLVLLDMKLPGMSGLQICDGIRQQSQVPIIFVTSANTSMDELNCMLRGGDDYIAKPYQPPILLAHISAVLKRTMAQEKRNLTQFVHRGVQLDTAAGKITKANRSEELTKNELKILYCLFDRAGEIVSRNELIDFLWENEIFIDDNTLSVNITRIRNKLEKIGAENFIETKRGLGYRI